MPTIYLTDDQLHLVNMCLEYHTGSDELAENTGIPDADNLLDEVLNSINNQTKMFKVGKDQEFAYKVHFLTTNPRGHIIHGKLSAADKMDAEQQVWILYPSAWSVDIE